MARRGPAGAPTSRVSTGSTRRSSASRRWRRGCWTRSSVCCWRRAGEALEEAGIDPEVLKGSRAGVFAGISSSEYRELLSADGAEVSTLYAATGTSHSTAIGRVAFTLGLEGPAIAVDTACSSSLVALHQAVMSLQCSETDLALAGGVERDPVPPC